MDENPQQPLNLALQGQTVAIAESRQLDILSSLIENRGGKVIRVPLISIYDAPDPKPVLNWLNRLINNPPDLLIVFTGEGLRRLLKLASNHNLKSSFIEALGKIRILVRGPKPERELKLLGLESTFQALEPTTTGVIATLDNIAKDISYKNKRIAVQLYGENPNIPLMEYLAKQQVIVEPVSPYIYADESEDKKVVQVISKMSAGQIDIFAFTSQPQIKRLLKIATKYQCEDELYRSFKSVLVAAVGPIVKEQLEINGINVDIMPQRQFFMKPLVTAMIKHLENNTSVKTKVQENSNE